MQITFEPRFREKRRIRSGERAKSNYSSLLLPPLLGGGGKPAGLVETTFDSGNTKSACVCKTGGAASCHFPPKKKIQTKSSKFSNAFFCLFFVRAYTGGKTSVAVRVSPPFIPNEVRRRFHLSLSLFPPPPPPLYIVHASLFSFFLLFSLSPWGVIFHRLLFSALILL